jgi:hypothetical protein
LDQVTQQEGAEAAPLEIIVNGEGDFSGRGVGQSYEAGAANDPFARRRRQFTHNARLTRGVNRQQSPQFGRRDFAQGSEEAMQQCFRRRGSKRFGNQRLVGRQDRPEANFFSAVENERHHAIP